MDKSTKKSPHVQIICNEIYNVPVKSVHFSKSSTIPGQDYDIAELLDRWSRGQRLNVPMRPIEITDDPSKSFKEAMNSDNFPQFEDEIELREYQQQHASRKREFVERLAKEKEQKSEHDKTPVNTEQCEVHEN